MREILFRGKDIKTGEWAYGYYYTLNEYHCIRNDNERPENMDCVVDAETVGEYVGVTDKYGKKIFEGDFVNVGIEYKALRIVEYRDTTFSIADDCDSVRVPLSTCATKCYEVVGNKWDNPELQVKFQ